MNEPNFEWYVPTTGESLFLVQDCKHRVTKELCLFGKYGEVWQDGPNAKICVFGTNPFKVAEINRELGLPHKSISRDDERIIAVAAPKVTAILEILEVNPMAGWQLRRAKQRYFKNEQL